MAVPCLLYTSLLPAASGVREGAWRRRRAGRTLPGSCLLYTSLAKRHCGVSHKELAGLLLSGRPLSDGRSPQSRLDDRTWVSRFIVHAPAGTLSDSYFCDYAVGALRFAARMKSRSKRALTGEAILDIVCGEAGRAMDEMCIRDRVSCFGAVRGHRAQAHSY